MSLLSGLLTTSQQDMFVVFCTLMSVKFVQKGHQ